MTIARDASGYHDGNYFGGDTTSVGAGYTRFRAYGGFGQRLDDRLGQDRHHQRLVIGRRGSGPDPPRRRW